MVTPNDGRIELTADDELFEFARCGLGALGVVTEATLQCVARHKLKEKVLVMDSKELMTRRNELLLGYRHCKWLWVPYSDGMVVVMAANPVEDAHAEALSAAMASDPDTERAQEVQCQRAMRELLAAETGQKVDEIHDFLSFADLRDLLLGVEGGDRVVDTEWVKAVNAAEMEYWNEVAAKERLHIDLSDNVLSFECGGQQRVFEVAFPIKRAHREEDGVPLEIQFALDVLEEIEKRRIPAASPLEQRFTARSTSALSPAQSEEEEAAFSWFGIICYLPTPSQRKRTWIHNEFAAYCRVLEEVADRYGAVGHWAKIETQRLNKEERLRLQHRLRRRYGHKLDRFLELRAHHDPKGILLNDLLRDCFAL